MSRSTHFPTRRLLRDLLAIVLLWALVLACYWRIALAGRVLAGGDVFTYFYPYWAEATRAIRAGRLPLWNPYLFMGVPFLANSQVGFFYPLNWPLWLLLPAHRSVHLSIVLHLCLAALNAYLWGRVSLRLEWIGAWTVGAVFALGGYLGAQVEHVNQLQGLAWLPLMLMLYESASQRVGESANRRRSGVALIGLAIVVGLVVLAGHTQTAFISLVGLGIYGLGPTLWKGLTNLLVHQSTSLPIWRPLARRAALLAAAAVLGIALAAVQLAPTWQLSRLSIRAEGLPFRERVSFSLSPLYLARALLPGLAAPVPPEHIEHVAYVGVSGLALVAVAILSTRHAPRTTASKISTLRPAICLVAVGLFFALGLYNPLYLFLARFVPGFAHFRVPARWLTLYAVGVAGLAGKGADTLWHRRGRISRRTLLLLASALIGLLVWAAVGARLGGGERVGWLTIFGWAAGVTSALILLWAASRRPRLATAGLLALLIVELFAAGMSLPRSRATAPQALASLRPAVAHLLASSHSPSQPLPFPPRAGERGGARGGVRGRFLSMSDITFDPGDLPEIQTIYGPQLSTGALYEYVIAAKQKEVLSPNLPLAFGVPAVDGYGGGVLPLARYVTLQRLLLPQEKVSIDGRLRENLAAVPDGRWLNLFNVRYVITDKLRDVWIDDVFYDLQLGASLSRGEEAAVAHVPSFEATALGVVSHLRDGTTLPDGVSVGVVEVGFGGGITRTFALRAGEHTAAEVHGPDVAHAKAAVGRERADGNDYVTRLRWQEPAPPLTVTVRATLPEGELVVRGLSLIDERTGGFQALVLSGQGRFRLVHSGDVKIYENLDALPRAFVVHEASVALNDEAALAVMRDPAFDPAAEVILAADDNSCGRSSATSSGGSAQNRFTVQPRSETPKVISYRPGRVVIDVRLRESGYLVLSDAWYPGWEAVVDGESAPVCRADLLFRAVPLDAGEHHVVFTFHPMMLRVGGVISVAALLALAPIVVFALRCPKRRAMI